MIDLEQLCEAFGSEIADLSGIIDYEIDNTKITRFEIKHKLQVIRNNLYDICEKLYTAFEEQADVEGLQKKCNDFADMMRNEIIPKLSIEEKIYIRAKYGIDLEER